MKKIILIVSLILISCSKQENVSSLNQTISTSLPIADDGYLYVLAWGQSNMLGANPINLGEPKGGDMTEPTNVFVPDLLGDWKEARYFEQPFNTVNHSNNIAIVFCRNLANKYGVKIRLTFFAGGGATLAKFLEANTYQGNEPLTRGSIYQTMLDTYATLNPSDYRPAEVVLFHQFESGTGITGSSWEEVCNLVIAGFKSQGWVADNPAIIGGEVASGANLSRGPHQWQWEDPVMRRIAHSDGLEQAETIHFLGTGYDEFGKRYMERYEQIIFDYTTLFREWPSDPTSVNGLVASDVTSTDFLLTWNAATSNSGKAIVGYQIQTINGYVNKKLVDGNTLSTRVNFTPVSEDTSQYYWDIKPSELVSVLAIDEDGNYSETDYAQQITVTPL